MSEKIFSLNDIRDIVRPFADKYKIDEVYLFGSYARGEADEGSDLDLLVYGGKGFRRVNVLAFGEDLREAFKKDVDAYEICEINRGTDFYDAIMRDKVKVI
ncbi:MAG: nucleotidyltransferase domain-containing protein [Oscillospiraceae bacterium]|nr:nucleotidyltransferase domain-containing protein [Oscillospiraceae bacterium]